MKTSAITRIIIYSLVIVLLLGILLSALGIDALSFRKNDGTDQSIQNNGSVRAALVNDLSIDWAAGTITVVTADIDEIQIQETGEISEKYTMEYELDGDTLEIAYSAGSVTVGFGSVPEKNLLITVPNDWTCDELELDSAGVDVNIYGLTVSNISCDGAGVNMKLELRCSPLKIDIDGMGCQMELLYPERFGYLVQMDGLGCEFSSNMEYSSGNGSFFYGTRECQVYVDGLGCSVNVELVQ